MTLNKKQSECVYNFIMRYNSDEEYQNSVNELYDENVYKLSILQIYALEEVLRYGTKAIFRNFLEIKGTYLDEQAVNLYDDFMKLLKTDNNFKEYKMKQFDETPETLSEIEKFAFHLISKSNDEKSKNHEQTTDDLKYAPFNPILYSNDKDLLPQQGHFKLL